MGVDVSSCFLPSSTSSSDASTSIGTGTSTIPLPRLRRLEIEGVSLEHLTRVLKARKKYGHHRSDSGTRPTPSRDHMRTSLISGLGLGPGPGPGLAHDDESDGMGMGYGGLHVEEEPVPALQKLIVRLPPRPAVASYEYAAASGSGEMVEGEEVEGSRWSSSRGSVAPEAKLAMLVGKLEVRRPSGDDGTGSGYYAHVEGEYRMPWFD